MESNEITREVVQYAMYLLNQQVRTRREEIISGETFFLEDLKPLLNDYYQTQDLLEGIRRKLTGKVVKGNLVSYWLETLGTYPDTETALEAYKKRVAEDAVPNSPNAAVVEGFLQAIAKPGATIGELINACLLKFSPKI